MLAAGCPTKFKVGPSQLTLGKPRLPEELACLVANLQVSGFCGHGPVRSPVVRMPVRRITRLSSDAVC